MWLSSVHDLNRGRLDRPKDRDDYFAGRASKAERIALQTPGLAFSVAVSVGIAAWLL